MNEKLARIPLAIASILLSLGLWLYVQYQDLPNQPSGPNRIAVPLQATGLRSGLWALNVPPTVEFTAEGTAEELAKIDRSNLVATVDLSNAAEGKNSYRAVLKAPTEYKVNWSPAFKKVTLTIERESTRTLPVTVDTAGGLNVEKRLYNNASTEPESVTIHGPTSLVNDVVKARVILDLSKVTPQTAYKLPVELLQLNDLPVSDKITCEPREVTVRPSLTIAPTAKSLLVSPIFKGQPLFGYQIVSYEVFPNQVNIRGESEAIAKLSLVETEPIDITGISKTTIIETVLNLSPGLRSIDANRAVEKVKVRIQVEKVPASQNPPPTSPPSNQPTNGGGTSSGSTSGGSSTAGGA